MARLINFAVIFLFSLVIIWFSKATFLSLKEVKIRTKTSMYYKIIIGVEIVLVGLFIVSFRNLEISDLIKIGLLAVAMAEFVLCRDGMGNNGFVAMGNMIRFEEIVHYDIRDEEKGFTVLLNTGGSDTSELTFDTKHKEHIESVLREKLPKKQRRLKKESK